MFWYLDKQTKEAKIFTSVQAIEDNTSIKKDTLYYQFTRKKRDEYETKGFRIVKTKPLTSKRK